MKLFLFNNDEKLIGTVSPLEGIQNEEINKIQTIECTVVYSELIEKASYIGHKDYSDNRIFHMYKIAHVTKTSTTDVKIVGVHTFFDDMESDGYVKDFRPTNRELVGVLTTILDGSRWQLGTVNIQRRYTGNFYYVTRKEAISKLIEATQIEIKPRLEFSRGKITGRYLDVFTRLGARNGKVFVHGRDLLTVSEKKSQGAIYTAVVGRGKGEETDTGGYGRRISFKDVEWRRTSGQPVDKPVGQEYVEIPAMTKLYGFEKGTKPRIKIVEFQDETDKEKLLRLSYEWLEKNSRIQVEYSAKVLNVGNLELGDTVGIFNPKLGIKYETRVFKVKRNLVNNKLTEFGIGDKVTTSPFSRTIELAKEMKNFQDDTVYWLDKIRERLSDKLINEDGYNYDLKADNEYKVPAGYYSFDKPIDQNPTKVVYMGAGKIAIANSKKPTGEWNWRTFLDGRGATLDLINTGVLRAGRIQSADGRSYWDLDTGEFHMEQSAINEAVKTAVNGKVQEIVGEVKKNLPTKEELKGKSSYLHKKYSDYPDGRNMNDNSTLKYIGIYTGDKQQAPTNASEYSWTKIKVDGKLYKAYSNSLNGTDFTLVEPDENAKLFAKNRPRVNIVNDNDISDIWQANMFLSFKPNTKYTLTARAKGNSNKLWVYFRNNKTSEEYSWGQLEFRGLETKSITFTTTNDVDDVLFKFVLVPEDEDWTGIQIDWFTIYEGDKRYSDYPVNEPAQYHKYRYFGYVFKEGEPVASDFEWFDLQQTSIANDKYTHIVYSDNADGSNFGREPKKYMGVARTTSPTQPADKTAYKWFKMKGEDGERGRDGVSSYIHRKYSDYSSGYGMDDNPNRKYIGIYTGTNPTPPTTASSYLWSKIKGEDGANGVPGAKGADGRTPYFHTAYANSPTGDRDFSTTNSSDKLYIGTYSDFEIADSTDYRKYKWVKIKGEDGRNGNNGRDGVSSYIYRKYSDNANGLPMSDNSNLKYIGIYTGTSATAPTSPSYYTWSKIKGEDGAQGVPGTRGSDGRTSYLHTAYANSSAGDRDFSTTNSTNKEYIGTYTDFEINDSNDYRRYKWVKIKGENGRDGKSINENLLPNSNFNQGFAKWEDKLTNSGLNHSFDHANTNFGRGFHIFGTANADYKGLSSLPFNLVAKQGDKLTLSMDLGKDALNNNAPLKLGLHYIDDKDVIVGQEWQTLDLATQNFEVRKYKRISRVFTVQKNIRKCRVMIYATTSQLINFYIDNIKLERGDTATDWSPAYEDLQGHSLTANLRFEGSYINNITNNVKVYLDVFYDGQKITDGFNAQIKFKGGILNTWSNFWTAKVDNTGFLTNVSWGNKEQQYPIALEVIVLVTYKDLNAVANARMENVPDVVEIKEVVKKYKTFESTLEGFTSVVGEINTKVLTKQQIRQNLSIEDVEKTGNDLYFNAKENLVANEYYTILADLDGVPANQKSKIYGASDGGDEKLIQNGLNYWVVKYPNNRGSINLYPLGANTKVKNVRIFKGDFRIKKDAERENLYSSSATDSGDKFIHLNLNKNKINGNVYTVKFDASGYSNGDRWDVYNRIGYDENNLTQLLRAKGNEFTFTINDNTTVDRMYIRMKQVGNTTISNVEIYDVSTEYVKNSQVSKLESSIKQTKDEIDLKVSKDNVINSINISAEGTRIKGDLIADYLYGKTIEGAVIQGNSKIKIGKHGYMIPAGDGLRFCLPEKPDANKGVGVQMLGNYGRDGDTAYGFYLYVDPNFDTREVAGTNSYLMTVNGYISTRGVNNLKFQNYSDNSTAIGVWDKNVSLLFDRTKNDIYYEWNGKIYSIWQMVDRFYSTTSDARLKKDIKPCEYKALDLIGDFKFKSFNWKHREQLEKKPFTEIGLIAQDVEKISKNFVTMSGEYKTLNQFNLLTYSLKAIQELSTENQQLKSQLNEMNERLTKLEDKINGNL